MEDIITVPIRIFFGDDENLSQWGWRVEEAHVSKTETKDYNTHSSKRKRANDLKFRLLARDGEKKK